VKLWSPGNYSRDLKPRVSCSSYLKTCSGLTSKISGFIATETVVIDELGIFSARMRTTKGKSKTKGKAKTRKEIQRAKYFFVKPSKGTAAYTDYFNPDMDVESRMMGLSDAVSDG
jgi:hypothetical protein